MAHPLPEEKDRWEDPIVAEVRRAREELFAAAGYDLVEFCRRLREQQQREGRSTVTSHPRRPGLPRAKAPGRKPNKRIQPTAPKTRRG